MSLVKNDVHVHYGIHFIYIISAILLLSGATSSAQIVLKTPQRGPSESDRFYSANLTDEKSFVPLLSTPADSKKGMLVSSLTNKFGKHKLMNL